MSDTRLDFGKLALPQEAMQSCFLRHRRQWQWITDLDVADGS